MSSIKFLFLLSIISLLAACSKADPEIPNEEEIISSLTYTLTPKLGGEVIVFKFQDLDGTGGEAPIVQGAVLAKNAVYTGELLLLNELENPAEDISLEIREEAEAHQFFFETDISSLSISYADTDANGRPLGLKSLVSTGEAASGTLKIVLRHEPNKAAAGVADGAILNAGGETDIELIFDVEIQ